MYEATCVRLVWWTKEVYLKRKAKYAIHKLEKSLTKKTPLLWSKGIGKMGENTKRLLKSDTAGVSKQTVVKLENIQRGITRKKNKVYRKHTNKT